MNANFIDAMANNYRTVVLPTIDDISNDTFEYRRQYFYSGFAARGIFNFHFDYKHLPLLYSTVSNPSKPFETPVMAGGLFAIHADFFWELGAYDEGLDTYGWLKLFNAFQFLDVDLYNWPLFRSVFFLSRWRTI